MQSNKTEAFFELVRAGLWEKEVKISQFEKIDFKEIYRLAEEQSAVGLVAAGLEHVVDVKIPQSCALTFASAAMQLEQRNVAMNSFISSFFQKCRENKIFGIIMKGQGIAQCYERPLWRACGDVDVLLNVSNYEKAKYLLDVISTSKGDERNYDKHIGYWVDSMEIELHGSLNCGLSAKMDKALDDLIVDITERGNVRLWNNSGVDIFLPSADYDVIVLFTHIIKHYYKGGVGIRQICDLCRLLWVYRDTINQNYVIDQINKMGLYSEWQVLSSYMICFLGLPNEAVPFYDNNSKWSRKAIMLQDYIIRVGNFGHNRREYTNSFKPLRCVLNILRRANDFISHARVFPLDSMLFFMYILEGKIIGRYR